VLSRSALRRLRGAAGVERRDGAPTGLVSGREAEITRLVGPLPSEVFRAGLVAAARELAACGLTTVADATPHAPSELAPLRAVVGGNGFPLRVYAMRRPGSRAWRGTEQLLPGPVKIMVEEGPDGLRPRPATLARMVARAARAGEQVAIHCVGAATLVASLAAFAALPARVRRRRRHRLEHVGECPPPLVVPLAALGLTVVTNPAFVHHRGDAYAAESPRGAAGWLYRARTLAVAGVPLAGASDAPVVGADPWLAIATARTRRTAAGRVLGGRERLDAASALALFTTGAADALEAPALGRLAVGGPADLVVVEPDPLRASADEVRGAAVRLTLVGGNVAWAS
jgi:predicted amidohydrolase YtcJ